MLSESCLLEPFKCQIVQDMSPCHPQTCCSPKVKVAATEEDRRSVACKVSREAAITDSGADNMKMAVMYLQWHVETHRVFSLGVSRAELSSD